MRRLLLASALALAGCAALIDINDYQPPPDRSGCVAAPDGGAQTLAAAPLGVHVALDDTDVYYSRADPPRDSAILRCSKCGCTTPQQLATLSLAGAIAVDDRFVFYTDYSETGSLNRLDKKTLEVQTLPNQIEPFGVALDDTYVYWTVIGASDVSTAGIWRATKADLGEVTMLAKTQSLDTNLVPYAITVDDTYVYFTTSPDILDGNTVMPCMEYDGGVSYGTVRRVPKNATAPTPSAEVVASSQPCPVGLALDADNIYWMNLGAGATLNGSVWSVPKSGPATAAQQLIGGLGRPYGIAASGGRLVWPSPGGMRIETCKPSGCQDNVMTLSSRDANPSSVAVDATGIYWVDLGTPENLFNDGALRRVLSPP